MLGVCVQQTKRDTANRFFVARFALLDQVSVEEFSEVKTHVLKDDGENIPVTNDNREG